MRKIIITLAALLLLPYEAFALPKVRIQLPWYLTVEWAGIVMAIEDGLDRKHGVDIDMVGYQPGVDPVESVLSGEADMGLIDGVNLVQRRAAGDDVVAVWAQMQTSPVAVCTLESADIESLADLKGRRFGIQKEYEYLLDLFLSRGDISKSDIDLVYIEGDPVLPLEEKKVDAVCCFDTYQPPILRIRGFEPRVLRSADLGLIFYEQAMFVNSRVLASKSDEIKRAVDAIEEGWIYALNNVDRTVDVLVKKYRPFDPQEWLLKTKAEYVSQQSASLKLIYTYMTKGVGMKLGLMRDYRWQQTIDMLNDLGMIDKKVEPNEMYTKRFIDKR